MKQAAFITSLLATSAFAATADQWRNRTIYQVCIHLFDFAEEI